VHRVPCPALRRTQGGILTTHAFGLLPGTHSNSSSSNYIRLLQQQWQQQQKCRAVFQSFYMAQLPIGLAQWALCVRLLTLERMEQN